MEPSLPPLLLTVEDRASGSPSPSSDVVVCHAFIRLPHQAPPGALGSDIDGRRASHLGDPGGLLEHPVHSTL